MDIIDGFLFHTPMTNLGSLEAKLITATVQIRWNVKIIPDTKDFGKQHVCDKDIHDNQGGSEMERCKGSNVELQMPVDTRSHTKSNERTVEI